MAKMVDASPPRNAANVVSGASATGALPAPAPSMTAGIVILLQDPGAAGSLVDIVAQLRCLPLAPRVVLLLERPADTMERAELDVHEVILSSPQVREFLMSIESADGRRSVDADDKSVLPAQPMSLDCLTRRERQIVEGVARGLRNKEIAREMRLRESTVKMHLHHIFEKMKLASRTQLALAYSTSDDRTATKFG